MKGKIQKKESVQDGQDLIVRRTAKDSVFCNLFSDKRYLLQLYQALHPEDTKTTEDDLTDITIRNVLTDGIYNDVGFRNKDKVIIHDYFRKTKADLYSSKKVSMPEAELYVIFTGKRINQPTCISLSEEFFYGQQCSIDVRAKVLYGEGYKDIVSQYVEFSKVYTEQVKKHGYTRDAVLETIRICRDKDVLAEYLRTREREVVSIMMALFDEEYIQEAYRNRITEAVTKEMTDKAVEKEKRSARKLYQRGFSLEDIAEVSEVSVEIIKQWLD